MSETKQLDGLFAVCDPTGHLVHTTVATSSELAIEQWMETESAINNLANMCRVIKRERTKCMQSWEQFEAEGYRIVPVKVVPSEIYANNP